MKLRKNPVYILIIVAIILLLPVTIRMLDSSTIPGNDNYYYLNADNSLFNHPYTFLLSLSDSVQFHLFLPVLLGLLSILFLHQLYLGLSAWEHSIFLLLLVFSPAFITSFTTLNPYSLLFLLLITGFYFLTRKNEKVRWIALPIFLLVPLFDIFSSLFLLLLLIPYAYLKREKISMLMVLFVTVSAIIVLLALSKPFFYTPFVMYSRMTALLSDFGGLRGLNVFVLILAFGGIAKTWKKAFSFPLYLLIIFLGFSYWITAEVMLFITIIVTLWAGIALAQLAKRTWKLEAIKSFTLFVIVLGVLFSSLSVSDRLINLGPSDEIQRSLVQVKEFTNEDDIILSSLHNGEIIKYYTQAQPLLEYQTQNFNEKREIARTIFDSSYVQDELFNQHGITVFYITPDMKQEKVVQQNEGLLFTFKNEKFTMVREENGIETWRYDD
ncbi:MAG: hypothetical protein CMH61_02745 [Nanoarchaeota archaeon]|nr:hypothetical protein [Nanoarchaeota archaeon]|tara:strand:- start:1198 stop:2514 length:1317 start_codon:yes stop_codon:yes gene_type:complete